MAEYTISHSEKNKGWTSFWSFIPDWYARLGKRLYTIKNGQLWIHNSSAVPANNFYGVQYGTSVKTVFNDVPTDDKSFKTLVLESPQKWSAAIRTNYTDSTITATEFNTRESRQFSFIRQNENADDYHGGASQGIGVIASITPPLISFTVTNIELVNVGDQLCQINGADTEVIGTITDVTATGVEIDTFVETPQVGFFAFAKKNARSEGSDVRGNFMEVLLTNSDELPGEIYAVSTEVNKSYV